MREVPPSPQHCGKEPVPLRQADDLLIEGPDCGEFEVEAGDEGVCLLDREVEDLSKSELACPVHQSVDYLLGLISLLHADLLEALL